MSVNEILLRSNIRDYRVHFSETIEFINRLNDVRDSIFIIDHKVWEYHHHILEDKIKKSDIILLSISEERKKLETVQELYDRVMERAPKKNMTVISVGGGITQDITGFMTSTLYRGVNWIFVPTTLLAQADSCIGSKTSLNYNKYKNLIGTFYPPSDIYIYTPFLKTQKEVDYFSGIGEVAKLHMMGGEEDINELHKNLLSVINMDEQILLKSVRKSLLIKQSYIQEDEFDKGRRNMLNFGHCFGHAIESATDFAIPHGQAVIIGIVLANMVAFNRGLLSNEKKTFFHKEILSSLIRVNLQNIPMDNEKIINGMKQDKKRTGVNLPLVMITDNYEMTKVDDLSEGEAI
ncbi:MAG: AroB-related putative sugar phosphate phospholyase (cyclizing), partial [Candidatus Eremiobacterota bacterium]